MEVAKNFLVEHSIITPDCSAFIIKLSDGRSIDIIGLMEKFGKEMYDEGHSQGWDAGVECQFYGSQ